MNGRLFLDPARDLIKVPTEAHRRAAAGRAYYAAFQEALTALIRWGVAIPPRENIHAAVRLRFLYARDSQAQEIGRVLDDLVRLRNEADYKLDAPRHFQDREHVEDAIEKSSELIDLLDSIESSVARRAEVIASIRL